MAHESKIAVIAAFIGNLLIAVLKLGAGLLSHSAAMLAEAAHSFSDVGNQILLMVGITRAKHDPTPDHPFGSGKNAYFWPFLVAVLLFGVAGAYSLIEGYEKVRHPHSIGDIRLSLGVLGAAFLIELASLTVAFREARKGARRRGILSVRAFLNENRDATLLTVLVEDSLALVGLPVAAAALLLAKATGNVVWDGIGSLVIGVMLMGFALFLAWAVQGLLIGRGLSARDLGEVIRIAVADPAIAKVRAVQSMYLGADAVLLGVEVEVVDDPGGASTEVVIARLEAALVARMPVLRFVYVEPHRAGADGAA